MQKPSSLNINFVSLQSPVLIQQTTITGAHSTAITYHCGADITTHPDYPPRIPVRLVHPTSLCGVS